MLNRRLFWHSALLYFFGSFSSRTFRYTFVYVIAEIYTERGLKKKKVQKKFSFALSQSIFYLFSESNRKPYW